MEEEGKIFQILSPQSKHRARELRCTVGKGDIFVQIFTGDKFSESFQSYLLETTGGPPLVRSPLVRFPLVRILVL